ncbi:MAG: peptide chain release factor-like protein [bacterium]|nr:peptide chain release factor-like protein [bacterium]
MEFPIEIGHKFQLIAKAIAFKPEDVDEHFARGSGHGGQSVNKSTNCVELHHNPTGIDVRYHHHKGLLRNRKEAWELMIIKVEEHIKGKESLIGQKQHKVQKQKQRRSRKAKEKMLEEKKKRSDIKEFRRAIDTD